MGTRMLQKYAKNHIKFEEALVSVTRKVPIEDVKQLAMSVEKFYTVQLSIHLNFRRNY